MESIYPSQKVLKKGNFYKGRIVMSLPIEIGGVTQDIVYDSANERMYVASFGNDTVTVINTNTPIPQSSLLYVDSPYGLAYDSKLSALRVQQIP